MVAEFFEISAKLEDAVHIKFDSLFGLFHLMSQHRLGKSGIALEIDRMDPDGFSFDDIKFDEDRVFEYRVFFNFDIDFDIEKSFFYIEIFDDLYRFELLIVSKYLAFAQIYLFVQLITVTAFDTDDRVVFDMRTLLHGDGEKYLFAYYFVYIYRYVGKEFLLPEIFDGLGDVFAGDLDLLALSETGEGDEDGLIVLRTYYFDIGDDVFSGFGVVYYQRGRVLSMEQYCCTDQ